MRLLQFNIHGDFSLTEFLEGDIPKKYAILSHRWGVEEVTFKDLTDGTSKGKRGYSKIQFCGDQARRDGLQYFWVDTCCIDKSNAVELQEAINSMFHWYRDATKCYVYMSDVSRPRTDPIKRSNEDWIWRFRKSEWFRRGWTLQELIAPTSVDFFSEEGELLGNKASLERTICEVTGIPANALRGNPLSEFSVDERLSWVASRETFRQEDKAYSLLGIFNINMSLIYGEGKENAFGRLRRKINKKINSVPLAPASNIAGQENVRHEKMHYYKTQRHMNDAGYSSNFRGKSALKCYRCDNCHRLSNCYASSDTVSKARDRRMDSNRCVNCGSEEHWERDCAWEDLREMKSR